MPDHIYLPDLEGDVVDKDLVGLHLQMRDDFLELFKEERLAGLGRGLVQLLSNKFSDLGFSQKSISDASTAAGQLLSEQDVDHDKKTR